MAKLIEDTIGKVDFQQRVAYRTLKTQSFFSKTKIECRKNSNQTLFIPMIVTYVQDIRNELIDCVNLPKDSNFSTITCTQHTLIAKSITCQTVPPALRLNKYHHPYELQLFNCDISVSYTHLTLPTIYPV